MEKTADATRFRLRARRRMRACHHTHTHTLIAMNIIHRQCARTHAGALQAVSSLVQRAPQCLTMSCPLDPPPRPASRTHAERIVSSQCYRP
eukprot:scaffold19768_cov128-Isochrysis_galbana.AAC.6